MITLFSRILSAKTLEECSFKEITLVEKHYNFKEFTLLEKLHLVSWVPLRVEFHFNM